LSGVLLGTLLNPLLQLMSEGIKRLWDKRDKKTEWKRSRIEEFRGCLGIYVGEKMVDLTYDEEGNSPDYYISMVNGLLMSANDPILFKLCDGLMKLELTHKKNGEFSETDKESFLKTVEKMMSRIKTLTENTY